MLSSAVSSSIRSQFETAVDMLGVPATWSRAKAPTPTQLLTVGFRTAGVKDAEIVNAYGINATIITVRATGVATAPEKFDSFTIQGIRYTADAVHPIHLAGAVIGWKVYCQGAN